MITRYSDVEETNLKGFTQHYVQIRAIEKYQRTSEDTKRYQGRSGDTKGYQGRSEDTKGYQGRSEDT